MTSRFYSSIIENLPEDLNVELIVNESDELEIAKVEVDELWSFVGNKNNDQMIKGYSLFYISKVDKCLQCK